SLFFMPMTTILLSDLNGPAIADAASLSTFIRTLGASFASSVTTWFWTHNASLHHSVLTEHINPYNPLAASFSGENSTSALMSINNTIDHQSYMLSTLDLFNILMWMFVVLIPFVFLTVRPRPAPAHGGAAH
ncbi:MAG: MFS transporter, partial [Tolumonas sp.]